MENIASLSHSLTVTVNIAERIWPLRPPVMENNEDKPPTHPQKIM